MTMIKPDGIRFAVTWLAQRLFMLPLVWLTFRVLNRVRLEGLEHLDGLERDRPIVLAPNHTSAWDSWVGALWPLSSLGRFLGGGAYCCVWAAPENIPTPPLRLLSAALGAIFVDRERGVEQPAIQDTLRLMRDGRRQVVITIYPEGTRSRSGRLRLRGKAGLGWVVHQTGAVVVPVYHTGARRMPGLGLDLTLRVGRPLRFDDRRDHAPESATWRGITRDVMEALRAMEREALGPDPARPSPREERAAA